MKHVIIGNGPAGVVAAEALRRYDAQADVTLIGEEPERALFAHGDPVSPERQHSKRRARWLRKAGGHYASLAIREVPGTREVRVDTAAPDRGVGGRYSELRLRQACWSATGSHPVRPPGAGHRLAQCA
jgi:NAD(P)H-nitrite reductase large subunit